MSYSKRVMEIISILLRQTGYIAVSEIANEMGISKRTVFREMDDVEKLVNELGMRMDKKTRLGLKLEVTEEQLKAFNAMNDGDIKHHYSQEARQNMIVIELLKSREPKKFYYFSKLLDVSEATISYDMDKIEPWFEQREIKLVRKPGYGVYLEGRESRFRKAIVDFLYQNYEHQDLVSLLESGENVVESVIDKEILIKVVTILKNFENVLAHRLTDNSYMGLVIHLAIAVQRSLRGEGVFMNTDILDGLRQDAHYEIARTIGENVEEVFNIKFPEDELGYITMHLKGSKLKTGALIDQNDIILTNFELSRLAIKMINKFKQLSGYDLSEDEKLLVGLVSHLRPAVTRMKLNLDIRNPLLNKIQEMYPEIYQMANETGDIIEDQYKVTIPDSEIGYLAMHFGAAIERYRKAQSVEKKIRTGVVCSSGIGTSSLLYSRLSKIFPKMDLIGQFSKEDILLGRINAFSVDLLISTIALEYGDCPVIKVNPLLLEDDIMKIRHVMGIIASNIEPYQQPEVKEPVESQKIKRLNMMTNGILQIEEGFKLYESVKVKHLQALMKAISDEKATDSRMKKKLLKQLNEREKLGTTLLHGEGVVLIHAKSNAVSSLDFSVWRLGTPILHESGEKVMTAVAMFIPENADKVDVELMSQLSKALIEESTFIDMIKSDSEINILKAIKRIMHKWLERQMSQGGLNDL